VSNAERSQTLEEAVEDPFLELVVASETAADYESLLPMARSALVASEASMRATQVVDSQILAHLAIIAPSTIDEKPVVVKKQYFVESSDNDLGGKRTDLSGYIALA